MSQIVNFCDIKVHLMFWKIKCTDENLNIIQMVIKNTIIYKWFYYRKDSLCRIISMLFGITILRLALEAKRLNAMSSACQCMSPRIVTSQNDKRLQPFEHSNTQRSCNSVKSNWKIAQNRFTVCIYVTWYVTALHIEHIGFLVWCTVYSGFIGIRWLWCTLNV